MKRKVFFVLIISLLGFAIGYLMSNFIVQPRYSTYTVLRLFDAEGRPIENSENRADLDTLEEALYSNRIRSQVLKNLEIDFEEKEFRRKIQIVPLQESELIGLEVKDVIPERTMDLANESAEILEAEIGNYTNNTIVISDPAYKPTEAYFPDEKSFAALGLIMGAIFSILYLGFKNKKEDVFYTIEDLRSRYPYPVLGEISNMNKETMKKDQVDDLFIDEKSESNEE